MSSRLPTTSLILAAAVFALTACATSAPAKALAPALEAKATTHPSLSRREVVKRLLAHNVRLFLYDGKEAQRSMSGVVVGSEVGAGGSGTYVLTSAHSLDTRGMANPEVRVIVDRPWEEGLGEPMEFTASLAAISQAKDSDLALLRVDGLNLSPAPLAEDSELVPGDDVLVVSAPFGSAVSLAGGLISFMKWHPKTGAPMVLKTDATVGQGASGGGVYSAQTGKLLAIIAGYRTAKLQNFELPLAGETFALPSSQVRAFLKEKGFAHLADHATRPQKTATR